MSAQNQSAPFVTDRLPILLRAFVESASKPSRRRADIRPNPRQGSSEWSLIFDTETTTDPGQALRIGFCRVYFRDELRHNVLFYDPTAVTDREVRLITRFVQSRKIELMQRDDFVDTILYKYGYHCRALIIGFNLPFDLSRLAISHASARGSMRGGFSLKLSPLNYLPPIQIKHLSKYVSMIRFSAPFVSPNSRSQLKRGKRNPHKRGYFLEVRALAAALFSRSFSLEALSSFLGVKHAKMQTGHHGQTLTDAYLEYAERDVLSTWECYRELNRRYEEFVLTKTPIHRIFSEASIGKAYFSEMAIQPWFEVQRAIPRKLLAQILSTYFGGRSEVRIRREMRQVMLCDFLSMYPTVCTLTGLWPFVISKGMKWCDGTAKVRRILKTWTLKDLQEKTNWRNLVALVQVVPDADIFPVRAEYNDGADGTIGANYLSSKNGLWFTLADCLASQILTGKKVKVIQAVIFKPAPIQDGLKSVAVSGNPDYQVDPYKNDFYKRMIELRHAVKSKRDLAGQQSHEEERTKFDVEQNALKIATNATSYGIFAEVNVNDRAGKAASKVHAANDATFIVDHIKNERPGRYFHPLLAATITGAARLMLAITERLILDHGLEWSFCDTDSMAIAKPIPMSDNEFYAKVEQIVAWFDLLNPYDFSGSILKIEDVNFNLSDRSIHEPLFVWAISAKRYALFNIANKQPVIRKASAHGLGHLQAPYDKSNPCKELPAPRVKPAKIGVELWHHDLWWQIIKAAIDGHPDEIKFNHHPALRKPAASRYAATTPKYLRWFDKYNDELPYRQKVKPFGFVSSFSARLLIDARPSKSNSKSSKANAQKPVAPFDKNPAASAKIAFDRITGNSVAIENLKTYREALAQYHLHPEDKFINGDSLDRGTTSRRHIYVTEIEYIGKESNKWEDQFYFGYDEDQEIRYGNEPKANKSLQNDLKKFVDAKGQRTAAKEIGISRSKLSKFLKIGFLGEKPQFAQRISQIIEEIRSMQVAENTRIANLLELARTEIRRTGISELARRVKSDPSNLTKTITQKRRASDSLLIRLQTYFDSRH